jgi:hypothetical protein
MRFIVLALLGVNVAFFCWARWIDTPPKPAVVAEPDPSVPPLQLVPEAKAATSPPAPGSQAAASAPAPPTPRAATAATSSASLAAAANTAVDASTVAASTSSAERCRSIGPFEDAGASTAAADKLKAHGFTPRDRTVETANPNVYWVYIGELTTDAQRRAIQTLGAAGIKDAAAMTQPEQSDRVSVGVFADQAHAVKRAEQVRALGFKPTLGIRQRTVNAHWLDFDLKSTDADPQPAELLGPTVRTTIGLGPIKVAGCSAGTADG